MPDPAHNIDSQFAIRNSQLPACFTPRRFAVFLLLAFVVAFPGIWMGTETFFRSDYGVMAYPAAHYFRESIRAGELPLWNPLSNCGAPFLAQWGTMCLYPGALFYVVFPMPWALGVFCLLHLWFGGLGARALAERWTGNRFAAAVAGTVFAFNGASLACLTWPNYCVALGWMPWIVLLTEQAWREGSRKLVLAALAGTMQMLTGVPELVILTWGLLGVILLGEMQSEKCKVKNADGGSSNAPVIPGPNFSLFIFHFQFLLRFAAIVALIAALSAAQLLPFFDLLAHSQRDASYRDARWPMPPWGWANLLVPLFRYGQTPQGFWLQVGQEFLSSYYLGLAPLALALLAVWKARERRVWLLAGATLFALLMALGDAGFLYTALKNFLPGGGIARFPVKFVLLAAFTVPMLAAFGVAWLASGSSRREEAPSESAECGMRNAESEQSLLTSAATSDGPSRSLALLPIGLALTVGAALIIWIGQQHPLPYDHWPETKMNALARFLWLAAALGAIAVVAGLGARAQRERLLAAAALLILLTADPLTHQPNQVPRIPTALVARDFAAGWKTERPPLGSARVMISPADEELLLFGRHANPENLPPGLPAEPHNLWLLDFGGKRHAGWSHLNLLDGLSKVNGSSNLRIKEQDELQRHMYPTHATNAPAANGLLDFLGVKVATALSSNTVWSPRSTGQPMLFAGAVTQFKPAVDTLQHLFATDFDPRREVFLPTEAQGSVPTNAANARVTTRRFAAHEILADVGTDAPTLVTVAQSFYHPWHAFVDDQPVKLWRANYAFQALEVPAGKHTVRLSYVDEKFRLGVGISLAGLAACGFLWWKSPRSKVQSPKPP
ncbi:MAG: hypothetical protein EBS05_26075 [Proteobacteria bacterium]|nr:hypothetical protein [Pseudomonadota bacterium]